METTQLNNIIPAERVAFVTNAIKNTFGQDASDIILLKGGLSGAGVYKIMVAAIPYVLKLDAPGVADIYATTSIAAAAGIAPKVFYADHTEGVSIYEFIEAKPIRESFTDPAELASELGKLIRKLHGMPVFEKTNDMRAMADGFIAQFKASNVLTGAAFEEAFTYYDRIKEVYPWHDTDKVSSHNDLNPNNILFDGERIRIIDWDAAFANDRYVDLAIAAISFASVFKLERALLAAYFGDTMDDYRYARFFLMRQICRLIYATLMFQLSAAVIEELTAQYPESLQFTSADIGRLAQEGRFDITKAEGQFYYGIALFNDALNAMRSKGFDAAMDIVGSSSR
ncbi:choline/ethanolamine kinase family protein [Taibaiella soli]|uniref:Aminoglycoside phosphotransferase domain-containing protein n=1 Tax=Taibaiella soli TaxID=1649169 RepID=A0A2W2AG62_9BACT|nr:choline/ethanolamine kinase family protein [Taibaiella soli]PZF72502.1 hypothetical protein DN068_11595 [Taibaiella soli]